jgi:hypothetical protein
VLTDVVNSDAVMHRRKNLAWVVDGSTQRKEQRC